VRRCRKDGIAPGRLGRTVQRVRRGAPHRVVRRGAMRLDRRLIAVDLVEVVDVRVLLIVQHVEAHAARLISLGAESIDLDRLQEALAPFRLDPHLYPQRYHRLLPPTTSMSPATAGATPGRARDRRVRRSDTTPARS